ncbi:hypothetical protein EOD10_04100 [Mesorhizobium sp. M7A.T.Ca.TU.009.01.3.2]|nr:hypothetical protein EOD10_04100 [Mesorhizobium sp. M7A.T.Ca.TU.009.01.3.2]RUV06409.1 hypothetical protein EOD00_20460 [Mesorhizobium sp. M7A.T.Ca.TU.009.01.3.1]
MGCPDLSGKSIRAAVQRSSSSGVCAAPHPPAGTFSPYSDGEKGSTPRPAPRTVTGRREALQDR